MSQSAMQNSMTTVTSLFNLNFADLRKPDFFLVNNRILC